MKLALVLVVVDALDHLGSDQRRLGHDALKRHHVVQLVGAQRSRVYRVLAEAANVGTIVYNIVGRLRPRAIGERLDNVFEGAVECFCKVERLVQEAVCELAIMCSDLVDADLRNISLYSLLT